MVKRYLYLRTAFKLFFLFCVLPSFGVGILVTLFDVGCVIGCGF